MIVRDARPDCAPACGEWVSAQGKIVQGTQAVFERVLRSLGSRKLPVFIDSLGGSVPDAMAIGRGLRARHLDVVVTRTDLDACARGQPCGRSPDGAVAGRPRGVGAVCASACVLVLAAGERREAAPWTLVGVHQIIMNETLRRTERLFRVVSRRENGINVVISRTLVGERALPTVNFTATPTRATYTQVSAYLAAMGVGDTLVPLMLATPPSGIHWVTADEQRATALVTDRVDGEYIASAGARNARVAAAAADGSSRVESIPEQAGLVIAASEPGKVRAIVGRVTWSLEQARPVSDGRAPVLGAEIVVPDAGLTVSVRISKPGAAPPQPLPQST